MSTLKIGVGDIIVSGSTGKWYKIKEVTNTLITAEDLESHSVTYLNRAGVTSKTFYKEEF